MRRIFAVLAVLSLADASAAQPRPVSTVVQRSEGDCSPPILNNSGQVTITCPGIDPRALRALETQLSALLRELREQGRRPDDSGRTIQNLNDLNERLRSEAADWERRYQELSGRPGSGGAADEEVRELVAKGDFDKAEALLQKLADGQERDIARAAATQYDLGELAMLRFDTAKAMGHYATSARLQPDEPKYTAEYGRAAYGQRHYAIAGMQWEASLRAYRERDSRDPGAYRPNVATILNDLGILYRDTGRLTEAEKAYVEGLAIRRELAARDPGAYRPYVATTLNNLAILYTDTGRLAEAEKARAEALNVAGASR